MLKQEPPLAQHTRAILGDDPEVAQRQIVEELVTRSQDEVRRRVQDFTSCCFPPRRMRQSY
eukprot:5316596-Amphidinium_carterae.2